MTEKHCKKCNRFRAIEEFARDHRTANRTRIICKECSGKAKKAKEKRRMAVNAAELYLWNGIDGIYC